jgi:hypothetical protein
VAERRDLAASADLEAERALQREANEIARKALNRSTWSTVIAVAALVIAAATLLHEVRKDAQADLSAHQG